jgi:DNA-binding HxlR family transcriptional regulator
VKLRNAKCPAEITLSVIGGRWKIPILYHLFQGEKRFSELRRLVGRISQKMLTQQLRELESDGIIHRQVYAQVPPRVDYSMTALGESLRPAIEALCEWGMKFRDGNFDDEAIHSLIAGQAGSQTENAAQHK